jgi:hypothetical protein
MLELVDRLRVEEMELSLATPLILATDLNITMRDLVAATSSRPMPSIRDTVPEKYSSMTWVERPMDSKTCAPQ